MVGRRLRATGSELRLWFILATEGSRPGNFYAPLVWVISTLKKESFGVCVGGYGVFETAIVGRLWLFCLDLSTIAIKAIKENYPGKDENISSFKDAANPGQED